jgi:choloylglycine hydrolase
MMLWMQYVVDNFESVDQVVKSAHDLTIDGWHWHFFTADREGNAAAIEFLDGKVVVHQGPTLPVPVLENSTYDREMERLKTYKGFGGNKPIDLNNKKQPTFVHGARMIKDFDPSQKPAVDYGFDFLAQFGWEGTQWSYVCDLNALKVYFKTKASPKIKTLDFKSFDGSCKAPVKMLDIHADLSGVVEKNFRDYSLEYNREYVRRTFVVGNYEPVFISHGSSLEEAVERFAAYPESTKCKIK